MSAIVRAFENAFELKEERGWDHIYVFIDIHKTIFKPTYGEKEEKFNYYEDARTALRMLSKRKDVVLGLYTCSYPSEIAKYLDKLAEDGIEFQLVNKNDMEKNTKYACFDEKPYFNVLLDDKAGFEPDVEWYRIVRYLRQEALIEIMRLDEEAGLYDIETGGIDGANGEITLPNDEEEFDEIIKNHEERVEKSKKKD